MRIEVSSAIKIQSLFRGYSVRRHGLSKGERAEAFQLIHNTADFKCFPRAPCGMTPVYLPDTLPWVFKNLGEARAKRRVLANLGARSLGYIHLVVPRSTAHQNWTIEEKLPVWQATLRSQTMLYLAQSALFSEAAGEFTAFLLKTRLPDALTTSHPYYGTHPVPVGRSDNIPLYIDKGVGKMALIDLGGLAMRQEKPNAAEIKASVETAIALFPRHIKEICKAAEVASHDFEPLAEKTERLFQTICLGREVTRQRVDIRESLEADLASQLRRGEILYYNFYNNREGQLMAVVHK